MKNLAAVVAIVSLIVNVFLWNKSHDLDIEIQRTGVAEKECTRQIQSIERDFQQQAKFYEQSEADLKEKKKELEVQVNQLTSQKDQLVEEKTRYFGENVGLKTSLDQLKQILSSQGRFEHFIEENFELKGKLAETDALLKIEVKKNSDLSQELSRDKNMISQLNEKLSERNKEIFKLQSLNEAYKADFEGVVMRNRNIMQSFRNDIEQMIQTFSKTNEKGSKRDREDAMGKANRIYNETLQKYATANNDMGNMNQNVSRVSQRFYNN